MIFDDLVSLYKDFFINYIIVMYEYVDVDLFFKMVRFNGFGMINLYWFFNVDF